MRMRLDSMLRMEFGVLCMLMAWQVPTGAVAQTDTKWRIGTPIVTYWAGPGSHNELNDTAAA